MFKAIGHCRVSKGDIDEIQNSLKSQKSEIIKFASRLDINDDEIMWFIEEEARSAYSERSDWSLFEQAIQEACNNPDIKYFLDFSQERFCRNRTRSQIYKGKLHRANVILRFVSGDVENPDSLEGFVLDSTNEMLAEMYSRKVGIDTLRGCKENAVTRDITSGYAYKNGGQAPFWLKAKKIIVGTDKYGNDIKKTIWVENDKVHNAEYNGKVLSKTIWEWARFYFIELRLNQKLGVDSARDVMNELKIPPPRKQYWAATSLYEAECNEALIGLGIYNRKQFARNGKGREKDKSEWIIVENAHPALLTKEEFEALKTLRKFKSKKKGNTSRFQANNDHLLIGYPEKFTCSCCQSKIISSGDVYTCGKYNTYGRKGCGASYFSVSSDWLENKILETISKNTSDKILQRYFDDFIKLHNKESGKPNLTNLKRDLLEKENAQTNLIKSLSEVSGANEFTLKAITKELDKVTNDIELIKKELSKSNKPNLVKIPDFETFKSTVIKAKLLLTQSNLHTKRELLWCFVESITLDPCK